MAGIFISHSSSDRESALQISRHISTHGYNAIFLDFDPDLGIPAGRFWEKELYRRLRTCSALLALCTAGYVNSKWCFAEVAYARALEKSIITIRLENCELPSILADLQSIDFFADESEGYRRLWSGLHSAGLDPGRSYDWDDARTPFPGLESYDEQDAAVFGGREDEIREVIETLTRARRLSDPRFVLIRGASGVGKSSLVRAGVIPTLRTDQERWAVTAAIRPAKHVNPIAALSRALCSLVPRHEENDYLPAMDSALRQCLLSMTTVSLEEAFDAAGLPDQKYVLIVIDQLEELLAHRNPQASSDLLRFIGITANTPDSRIFILATLRSDFLAEFETRAELQPIRLREVRVLPARIDQLIQMIERPAELADIRIEQDLISLILSDTRDSLALPLVAYVLGELWTRFGRTNRFTIDNYQEVGGLAGAIARSAERAYQDVQSTSDEETLRRAFIAMVGVGDNRQLVRQVVAVRQLPEGAIRAIERFVMDRLLVSGESSGIRTVEVAHEMVFDAWHRLRTWIKDMQESLRRPTATSGRCRMGTSSVC